VTEDEWVNATAPMPMLEFLRASGRVSDRKLRLFDVACCRRVWHLLTDERSRQAVDAAEKLADNLLSRRRLLAARAAAQEAFREAKFEEYRAEAEAQFCYTISYCKVCATLYAAAAARVVVAARAGQTIGLLDAYKQSELRRRPHGDRGKGCYYWAAAAARSAERVRQFRAEGMADDAIPPHDAFLRAQDKHDDAERREHSAQVDLLRDIIGPLPFRPVTINPDVLAWNDRLVLRLAQAIYGERRWTDMPVMADALLDAGCDNEDMLGHCREQRAGHTKGCWVIDLLLGKS
jgi:hypothetical protein